MKCVVYALWSGLALHIAIVDYKTRLIYLWQLLVFAVFGGLVVFVQDKPIVEVAFIVAIPLMVFALGLITRSMVLGGADWIFFPAFLVFFPFQESLYVFMISILMMSLLSQIKGRTAKDSKHIVKSKKGVSLYETPFITVLVFAGVVCIIGRKILEMSVHFYY